MSGEYAPRRILVTGGAGFIGSHVVVLLAKKYPEYTIVNLDKLDYCSSLRNLAQAGVEGGATAGGGGSAGGIERGPTPANYRFIRGDICSPDLVNHVFETERIDTVLHFAAQTHVDNSFGNSFSFTRNNILGTHVLLEASKLHGVKRFVHVSTDEVYGEGVADGSKVMLEEHVLEPTNPYAATKAAAEFLVKAYHRSFQLPVIITRGNNVYGPHQFPEKLIPKFINQLRRGAKVTLHGDGHNSRNYLYVEDVARAFDVILHRGTIGCIYNLGGTHELSNLDVAKHLIRMMYARSDGGEASSTLSASGSDDKARAEGEAKPDEDALFDQHITFVEDRAFNDLRYQIDSTRLRSLGWEERVSWEEGLRKTVDWYLENSNNWPSELVDAALTAHPRMVGVEGRLAGF